MNHDGRHYDFHHRDFHRHQETFQDESSDEQDAEDEGTFHINYRPNPAQQLVHHPRREPHVRVQNGPRRRRYSHPDPDSLASQTYVAYDRSMTPNTQVNIYNRNDDFHDRGSPLLSPLPYHHGDLTAGARRGVSDRMNHSDRLSQNICLHDGCAGFTG